tara:strand:+ start:4639 stop:5391 length:753 start_codon:yes stop_codon:yes gene_type:complete
MKVLELFSGTGSVGKVCKKLDWEVVSVDMLLPADYQVDIMEFDYKQYPKDEFDIVWASPPCTYYSNLQNCWIGRKKKDGILVTKELIEEKRKESDILILKTLEIIDYFKPELWFMENPQTGQLKKREVVKNIPYYDVSYCMYSDWGYEKRTRIWTNKKDWDNKICDKSGACGNMIDSQALRKKHRLNVSKDVHTVGEQFEKEKLRMKHKSTCDGGYDKRKKKVEGQIDSGTTKLDRYRIPDDLIFSLFQD